MKSLLSELILPLSVFCILILVAVFLRLRKKKKSLQYLMVISACWFLIISTPFLPNLLASYLENQFEVISPKMLNDLDQPVNILVLGGGHTSDDRLPANNQLSEVALARLAEGIRLHRQIPNSSLITSGFAGQEGISQAEVLAKAAVLLGIDEKNIRTQTLPENTWMEATEYKRLFGASARLIIITSALHMPRAMKLFHKAGIRPIAAPTNHLVKKGKHRNAWCWIPSSGNIRIMESALHEYAGIVWANFEK
jgi:uncharacterized SAM-binding protein YcdF (DUF218 family)